MAADDIPTLRDELPRVFEDHEPPDWWDDHHVIPVETGRDADFDIGPLADDLLGGMSRERASDEMAAPPDPAEAFEPNGGEREGLFLQTGIEETFPGSPRNREGGNLPPPDALGFYFPFHFYYPDLWGVYLIAEGILGLRGYLYRSSGKLSMEEAEAGARLFIYYHEAFHHKVESMATRLEVTHRQPLFKRGFLDLYRRTLKSGDCTEEALASAHAVRKVTQAFKDKGWSTDPLHTGLEGYLEGLPDAYSGAMEMVDYDAFCAERNSFAEANQQESLPIIGKDEELWNLFNYAFSGITQINSYTNYIVRKGGPLSERVDMPTRRIGYGDLKDKLDEMVGLRLKRQGKGSHEIYETDAGNRVTLYYTTGDIPKGTLNAILKDAGVGMNVHDFLRTRV